MSVVSVIDILLLFGKYLSTLLFLKMVVLAFSGLFFLFYDFIWRIRGSMF